MVRVFPESWLAAEGKSNAHQNCTDIYIAILHDRGLLDDYLTEMISVQEGMHEDIQNAAARGNTD